MCVFRLRSVIITFSADLLIQHFYISFVLNVLKSPSTSSADLGASSVLLVPSSTFHFFSDRPRFAAVIGEHGTTFCIYNFDYSFWVLPAFASTLSLCLAPPSRTITSSSRYSFQLCATCNVLSSFGICSLSRSRAFFFCWLFTCWRSEACGHCCPYRIKRIWGSGAFVSSCLVPSLRRHQQLTFSFWLSRLKILYRVREPP